MLRRARHSSQNRRTRLILEPLEVRLTPSVTLGQQPGAQNNTEFHGDAARSGFDQIETVLTPANVASSFGQVWQSPQLDGAVYATPLFLDSLLISGPGNAAKHAGDGVQNASFQDKSLGVVFAATGGGSVYAIAAQDTNGPTGIAPGTILWKTHLGNPYGGVDGNSIGVLSTPIIDLASGRLYVTASVTDYLTPTGTPNHGGNNFEVFALSLHDGSLIAGWPIIFTQSLLDSLNRNTGQGSGIAVPFSSGGADQRGALNLNADGSTLYVDWACYGASNPGWMTTVATGVTNGAANGQTPAIVSAFSAVDSTSANANGGMWGAGGPTIDASGNVFVTTGDSPGGTGNPAGDFGNSVLEFGPGQILTLVGIYSPWNYPTQDTIDSDLGGGSAIVITLPTGSSTTTDLVAFGGKQGNGYLADAGNNLNNPTANLHGSPAAYPASLTARPPGNLSPDQDASLYDTTATGIHTYWQGFSPQDGPLTLFGPYNESSASGNTAKARDTPATFTGPDGSQYVIFAGSSKMGVGSSTPTAPSLIVTKIIHTPGQPAYLQVVSQNTTVMSNPGSNLITGNGTANEIDWVVDAGVQRTDSLTGFSNGDPVLYAYNAITMQPIWSSAFQELNMGGKYNSVAVARGDVFIGTNRIQAFGLTSDAIVDDSVAGTGTNQFSFVGSGWAHITGSTTMGTFNGTVSTDNVKGDSATLSFTGSQIKVYANEVSGYGTATFSVDGGNTKTVTLTPSTSSPNGAGAGDVLVYTVTGLGAGTHTFKILNNATSNIISIDRVEITPPTGTGAQLGISMTDGNVIPTAQAVIPYTINYNNAGSVLNNTGTAASGVVLTETVPANATADLANSTAGWTRTSGNGGAGSTYTFTVGNFGAGITGSAVFSVDLNATIPPGTTSISDNVSIADAVADHASGSRITPIPPPSEVKLVFSTEPPATGSAGIALNPPIAVSAEDQFDNTFTLDSISTVTLTLSGSGSFSTGSNTATAQVVNGVATFNNLVVVSAGTFTMTATDGLLTSATSSAITIAGSSKLAFLQQPTQTVAGVSISPPVTVAVESAGGTVIASDNSMVTLTISSGAFANGSTTMTVQAVQGVATFSGLTLDTTGSYNLTAADGALTSAHSNPFNIVAQATKLVFTQQPNNTYAGEAVNPTVAVSLEDGFGNVATGNATTVTVSLSGGTFFGGGTTATATAINGVASFNNLVVVAPGTYTLTATDPGLTSAASFSFTVGTHTLLTVDDDNANNTGGTPQVAYSSPTSWVQTATSLPNNVGGTITSDSIGGDTATLTFTGTLITLYAAETPTAGSAQIFIDGNSPAQVDLASATSAIAPIFTSALLTAGSHTIVVKVVSGDVGIDHFVIGPATPTVAWATPADLTFGTALDGTQLDAFVSNFAGFPGTFTYSPPLGTMLPVGHNQPLTVTFAPTDAANYDTANATVLINVEKATPVITWDGPDDDMTFGEALGPDQLNATATVNGVTIPGTIVYSPGAGVVPPTGQNFGLSLTFTPFDSTDYNAETVENDVDVDPATPVITWPNPADIIDGTALTSAQLNATANVPGTFAYSPAAGTVLAVGQHQSLGVIFTPTDVTDYNVVGTTAFVNVDLGPAAKLAFLQQPTLATSGANISPSVTVAVKDSAGSTLPGDTSLVTLTLSGGTFVGGGNTVSVPAVAGVATFSNLAIVNNGLYTLTASDGSLATAVSDTFAIGATAFDSFNGGATSFASSFATNLAGTPGGTSLNWYTAGGIKDQGNGTAGGGVAASATDETAIYTPTTFSLADGAVHTISQYVTAENNGSNGNTRVLQIGFVTSATAGFNVGFSFISARVSANDQVEFQASNGPGTSPVILDTTAATGTIANGDWLQLVFTTQEVASGSFKGTFSLLDYGPTGVAAPTMVVAPVPYAINGLTTIGTASAMRAGFHATNNIPVDFDNFMVDSSASKLAYLAQPTSGAAGTTLGSFVAAVEDINSNVLVGDTSTVILTISHGTFANGQTTVSARAVDGIATFTNLQINAAGSYILRATDDNPDLDPGFAPITVNGGAPAGLAFVQQPTEVAAGAPISPAVTVAVEDANGNLVEGDTSTVTLTLNTGTFAGGTITARANAVNGVATFSGLIVRAIGNYSLTASDGSLTGMASSSFAVDRPTTVYVSNSNFGLPATPILGQLIDGDQGTSGIQPAVFGSTAFTSIANALAIVSASGTIVVNGGAYAEALNLANSRTLQLTAGNLTLNTLDTAPSASVDLQANRLIVGVNSAVPDTIAGSIRGSGGSLTKAGSDTLTLGGADTYTGGTTVSAGTLLVNGSLASAAISVASGATLGGTGTVAGTVMSSGSVAPGIGAGTTGTLTTGPVTLGPGTLALDLATAAVYDSVNVSTVNLTGATLSLNVGAGIGSGTFTILTVAGTSGGVTGAFSGLPNLGSITVGGVQFTINYAGGDGNDVVLTATPAGGPNFAAPDAGSPSVVSTILNGGISYVDGTLAAEQHSMVENVVYSFSQAVTLSPANFTLTGFQGTPASLVPNVNVSGAGTMWTVTFTGVGVNAATHSIGDGEYSLVLSGVPGMANNTYDFYRLLGDMDGNGSVDTSDFSTLISTFLRSTSDPLYLGADDFDGDNTIGTTDFAQFTANFLKTMPTPLPN
jgi:hypothetical protein